MKSNYQTMKYLSIIGFYMLIVACSPDENVEKLCLANPQGNIEPGKVNITSILGSTTLLNEGESDQNIAEAPNQDAFYSITDVVFTLGDEVQAAISNESSFTNWVQFDPEAGSPSISFKVDNKPYSIDPSEWLILWNENPFPAGIYIYYIVIEDLSKDQITLVIREWENYDESCDDVIESYN